MTKRKIGSTHAPRAQWPDSEVAYLRERYPHVTAETIARVLGKTVNQVYRKAKQLELEKSAEFFASSASGRSNLAEKGTSQRFQKGLVPWNKGKKGVTYDGMQATQFKPGQRPHNSVPVGTVLKRPDGYLWVKLAEPNEWTQVHRKNWQDVHGPIPPGKVLSFKDGNRANCAIDNLELITKRDVMLRNTLHNFPKEITQLIQLRAVVTRQINKGSKS